MQKTSRPVSTSGPAAPAAAGRLALGSTGGASEPSRRLPRPLPDCPERCRTDRQRCPNRYARGTCGPPRREAARRRTGGTPPSVTSARLRTQRPLGEPRDREDPRDGDPHNGLLDTSTNPPAAARTNVRLATWAGGDVRRPPILRPLQRKSPFLNIHHPKDTHDISAINCTESTHAINWGRYHSLPLGWRTKPSQAEKYPAR